MHLNTGGTSNPSFLGPSEPGILCNNQSAKLTASAMGPGAGGNRLSNLLPTRDPKQQAGRIIQVHGVPPREGGDRKPADYDGFAGKTRGEGKPERKKKHHIHLLLSPNNLTNKKKVERGVLEESP